MDHQDVIWVRARQDLVIDDDQGLADVFLWEHSVRVMRSASQIAQASDVARAAIDLQALAAASLYHDAGWVIQLRQSAISRTDILCKSTSDLQRELGATLMEERLAKLLPPGVLRRAGDCIRLLPRRDEEFPEAQILFDADNLDQIGTLSLWRLVRRYALEGKGVQAALDTWHRQQEYRFWKARIDNFRYASVRQLARKRFQKFESFMAALAHEHDGTDLGLVSPGQTPLPSATP